MSERYGVSDIINNVDSGIPAQRTSLDGPPSWFSIGDTSLRYQLTEDLVIEVPIAPDPPPVPSDEVSAYDLIPKNRVLEYFPLPESERMLASILKAMKTRSPLLLLGGTNIGKSSLVEMATGLAKAFLSKANCHDAASVQALLEKPVLDEENPGKWRLENQALLQATEASMNTEGRLSVLFLDEYTAMSRDEREKLRQLLEEVKRNAREKELTRATLHLEGREITYNPQTFVIITASNHGEASKGYVRDSFDKTTEQSQWGVLDLPERFSDNSIEQYMQHLLAESPFASSEDFKLLWKDITKFHLEMLQKSADMQQTHLEPGRLGQLAVPGNMLRFLAQWQHRPIETVTRATRLALKLFVANQFPVETRQQLLEQINTIGIVDADQDPLELPLQRAPEPGDNTPYASEIPRNVMEYVPFPEAEDAVEALVYALRLGIPLLLRGGPNCGKTDLVRFIAEQTRSVYMRQDLSASTSLDSLFEVLTINADRTYRTEERIFAKAAQASLNEEGRLSIIHLINYTKLPNGARVGINSLLDQITRAAAAGRTHDTITRTIGGKKKYIEYNPQLLRIVATANSAEITENGMLTTDPPTPDEDSRWALQYRFPRQLPDAALKQFIDGIAQNSPLFQHEGFVPLWASFKEFFFELLEEQKQGRPGETSGINQLEDPLDVLHYIASEYLDGAPLNSLLSTAVWFTIIGKFPAGQQDELLQRFKSILEEDTSKASAAEEHQGHSDHELEWD